MSNISNAISSNETILNIYNQIKDNVIKLKPDFQRKLVWNDTHKENFIDTILNNYPFPEIYIADGKVDLNNPRSIEKWVVDGQQRLSTIMQYIDGELFNLKKIKTFKNLTSTEKEKFYYYKVVIRSLGHLEDDEIREVFRRINSVSYALNAIEITNALYDGEYISTANSILESNKNIWEKLDIFSTNEQNRMKDLEYILTLMSIYEEKGYFTTTQKNELYIKEYNDNYDNRNSVEILFSKNLENINSLIDDSYSIWCKKSNFLTLFIELIRFSENISNIDLRKLKSILDKFGEELLKNKNTTDSNNKFVQYYLASIQGTGSKTSRITRGKILQEFIKENYY
mgnify:CR=1 FL=1